MTEKTKPKKTVPTGGFSEVQRKALEVLGVKPSDDLENITKSAIETARSIITRKGKVPKSVLDQLPRSMKGHVVKYSKLQSALTKAKNQKVSKPKVKKPVNSAMADAFKRAQGKR